MKNTFESGSGLIGCDPLGQVERRTRGEVGERVIGEQLLKLVANRLGDVEPAVSQVGEPQAGRGVEIPIAILVENPATLAPNDDEGWC